MGKTGQLSSRLEQLIEKNGGSINALAIKAGVDQSSLNKIMKGKLGLSPKMAQAIADACGVSAAWVTYGEGDVPESDYQMKRELKPHFFALAHAGMTTAEQGTDYEMQPMIAQMPRYDYTVEVRGDSMAPEYKSGDIVACLNVTNEHYIQRGRTHLLNTSQGVIIKKIIDNGETIRCISVNKEYPSYDIPKSDVYSIGLVVGILRIE